MESDRQSIGLSPEDLEAVQEVLYRGIEGIVCL